MDGDGDLGAKAQVDLNAAVFPLEAIAVRPADLGADCQQVCTASDGVDYVIKDGSSGQSIPKVPHCEWFCTHLSEALHIAAPTARVIRMPDGTLVFGSRFEGGVLSPSDADAWWSRSDIDRATVKKVISQIYAFDQFVSNEDRHLGNYIIRPQQSGHAILANDYSRAWICNGFPLPAVPLDPCATVNTQRYLSKEWGGAAIDPDAVDVLLERLKKIERDRVSRIILGHPEEWLSKDDKSAILDWWKTDDWMSRIADIARGVRNDVCL